MSPDILLLNEVRGSIARGDGLPETLGLVTRHFGAEAATIHTMATATMVLTLAAHLGIPDSVVSKIQFVPIGKGMAGLAAERREPVEMCNLQTDESGVARPAARDTQMRGSIAVPIIERGEVRGVVGIAKAEVHHWTEDENRLLSEVGSIVFNALSP
jgi:signal transduction protein with GAF and PtsI domain